MTRIVVNGDTRVVAADPPRSLLHVLREELGLTGAKYGCGEEPAAPVRSSWTVPRPGRV